MADPKLLENLNIPGVGALVVSDANAVKGAGISAATSVQNNDTSVPTGKAVTTELNKKQNTLAAGTGLAFGTGADANKLGHSNSVTAKTSSSVKKFTYDANGHVTGSSELSTAESNTLASGITSTDVAQITTNKNNILSLMTPKKGSITWETGWTPTSENVSIRQYDNIIVGQIYCRFSTSLPTTPDTQIGTINIVGKPRINFRGIGYVSDQLYDTPTATANVFISESTGGLFVLSGANNAQAIRFNFVYCTSDQS